MSVVVSLLELKRARFDVKSGCLGSKRLEQKAKTLLVERNETKITAGKDTILQKRITLLCCAVLC
jgi:hypothetical protein